MKILKDEQCPKCGGRVSLGGNTIYCTGLGCTWEHTITDPKTLKKAQAEEEEVNTKITLTKAGQSLSSSFKKDGYYALLELVRLTLNYEGGYEIRECDKQALIGAGLAEEIKDACGE